MDNNPTEINLSNKEKAKGFFSEIRNSLSLKNFAYLSIGLGLILVIWFLVFGNFLTTDSYTPDMNKIKNIHPFISGIVLPTFTLGTTLLVIETFKNSNIQNVYNNVFKMIDQNRKILEGINCDSIHLGDDDIKSKGKDFFDDLADRISKNFADLSAETLDPSTTIDEELKEKTKGKTSKERLIAIYDYYFHIYQSDLGHYFRNLFHTVRYIDNSKVSRNHKNELIKILRSNLSNYELLLLAYNCLHPYGNAFFNYVEEYQLLKSLNNEINLPRTYNKRIINDLKLLTDNYTHLKKLWPNLG